MIYKLIPLKYTHAGQLRLYYINNPYIYDIELPKNAYYVTGFVTEIINNGEFL